jgi:hypothetical protein
MKISLDLDGSVWSHKSFFRELMIAMQAAGHQVGILTAHRDIHRDADLFLLTAENFPMPDFFYCRPYKSHLTYAEFKAQTILNEGIDIAFDDCNFDGTEVEATIRALLGDQKHRLIKVTPRFPENVRYE